MEEVAKKVKIRISDEEVEIDIYVNERGNLELRGIGSVTFGMLEEELELARYKEGE